MQLPFQVIRGLGTTCAVALAALAAPAVAEAARGVYVTNSNSDAVSAYVVAPDGSLTELGGSPYAAGIDTRGVVATPNAEHLYATNYNGTSFSAFDIGTDGALSTIAGSPFPAGDAPNSVAVSPDGSLLYATNLRPATLSGFEIGPDGALTALSGSPFATGFSPDQLAFTPSGGYLYTTTSDGLLGYSIGPDGSPTQLAGSPFAPIDQGGIQVTPDGDHLYAASTFSETVHAYAIGADGSLTELAGSPVAAGTSPNGVALAPDGEHLYVANYNSNDVSAYSVGADGALTELAASPFPTGGDVPTELAITPDGDNVYVTNQLGNIVTGYGVAADGSLAELASSPFATGATPGPITIAPDQPPVASIDAPATNKSGLPISFDASPSSDSDGAIARYDWDFGDGSTVSDGGQTETHSYVQPGTYEVTLTLTDDEGCSMILIYTGKTALCNGGPGAATTREVTVEGPETTIRGKPRFGQKNDTRLRFFSSIPDSTFECKLNRKRYRSCESPKNYKNLKPGKYRFRVFATTAQGIVDPTPAKIKFKVKDRRLRRD
jgi:6-phosphogluconolactonase (cycloisomerase 2 family)